ncbi:MAG: hypothetical protein ABSF10_11115 [Verrucomicrobiota bacterium]|jgi:hypothetical protein
MWFKNHSTTKAAWPGGEIARGGAENDNCGAYNLTRLAVMPRWSFQPLVLRRPKAALFWVGRNLFASNNGSICQLVFPFSYRRRDFGSDAHAADRHLFVENTLRVGSIGTISQTRAENDFIFPVGASKPERLSRHSIQF